VAVGVGAAVSVQQAAKRWSGFNTLRGARLFLKRIDCAGGDLYGRSRLLHPAIRQKKAAMRAFLYAFRTYA
jgi:hypothetical protein